MPPLWHYINMPHEAQFLNRVHNREVFTHIACTSRAHLDDTTDLPVLVYRMVRNFGGKKL